MAGEFDPRVLIVGAGPVGLALALELGLCGIECLVIDRRDGSVTVPKMTVVSTRNMEFCRRWGIADRVRDAVWDRNRPLDFVYLENLAGRELARFKIPAHSQRGDGGYTPEIACHCPQIYFDPMLAARVREQPSVAFGYNTELESFTQDRDGVVAVVRDEHEQAHELRVEFLVGCDGAAGRVRRVLDIPLEGLGIVANSVNIFFRSPTLSSRHDKGWARIYRLIDADGCWSELIPIDGRELWRLVVFDESHGASDPSSYLARMFGGAFEYEILDVSAWERRDYVATKYHEGRVLIAGDAAHQCSPTGGLGMATGIEEAVNLGWKLSGILQGWGGVGLLESYASERRPIARRNVDLSTRTFRAITSIPNWQSGSDPDAYWAELDLRRTNLGRYSVPDHVKTQYTYENSAICVADGTPPENPESSHFVASTRPGARAPHAWLDDGRSTLDLFGDGFALLRLGAEPPQTANIEASARSRGVPLHVVRVAEPHVADLYEKPLVLVRPDGHVAWRGSTEPDHPLAIIDRIRGC
jgi:2-polyprenyl-6-methoxyphenol hydroxylase-like FAD-dependent oxidoreductase